MAKKEVVAQFKIRAPGGTATPAPPVGPTLGQYGVNPGQFIQQFNAKTSPFKGQICVALVTTYKDRTFTFEIKSSPAASLLLEKAGVTEKNKKGRSKGSGVPNKNKVGKKITMKECEDIAKVKLADMNAFDIKRAARTIAGTARSMGIVVEG
jgi:large subunit ribosomal protein L11